MIVKSEKQVREKLNWLLKQLDDSDCQTELMQAKLWAKIDFIKWLLGE